MSHNQLRVIILSSPGFEKRLDLVAKSMAAHNLGVQAFLISSQLKGIRKRINIFKRRLLSHGYSLLINDILPSRWRAFKLKHSNFNNQTRETKSWIESIRVPSFHEGLGLETIRKLSPDLLVLAGVHILPQLVLDIPRMGVLNCHLGLVPGFRGNYPVHWALLNEAPVGVTVHWVDAGLDTGPVIYQKIIDPPEHPDNLAEWVYAAEQQGALLLGQAVRDIVDGRIKAKEGIGQDAFAGHTYRYMPPALQKQLRRKLKDAVKHQETQQSYANNNILITTQVFPPEVHPSAVMVKELAGEIASNGYQVTVAAGYPHHPYGRLYPGYRKRFLKVNNSNGIRVVRGWHFTIPSSKLLLRTLVMASQSLAYLWEALAGPRPDVIISYGPPLIGPLFSILIAHLAKAKLLTLIYDLYPDILVETGSLKSQAIIRAAQKLERFIYARSDLIGVLSAGFRSSLAERKGVASEKIAVIPVWLDVRDITPLDRDNLWRREMHIPLDKFVVLYAGTIGLVSGAEILVQVAKLLQPYPDILLIMVGEGFARDKVELQAKQAGLTNVRFFPFQPRPRLSEVQATADISLVTLAPGRGRTSVPSKVLGYMAAARPVIASVDDNCDTADLIRSANCGLVTPPADAGALAQAILRLVHNPELRQQMGQSGQRYFAANLERKQVLTNYISLVERMMAAG